jgi:hypothetical protein
MHNNLLNNEARELKYIFFISYLCGLKVQNYENKMLITTLVFAHYSQPLKNSLKTIKLFTFLYPTLAHAFYNKCVQLVSVRYSLYTLFTGPITTTTFNTYIRRYL